MSVCMHLPSVICDNCAHLNKSSAKGPYIATITTGGTYISSQDFSVALRQLEIERDEARSELSKIRRDLENSRAEVAELLALSDANALMLHQVGRERDEAQAQVKKSWKLGALEMREAAAEEIDRLLTLRKATSIWVCADDIRSMPLPDQY